MAELKREIIHIISRYSNWSAEGIEQTFKDKKIYADQNTWIKFVKIFLIGLGVSFAIAGIIFFFAYNWASMHKFLKLGLLEVLIVGAVLTVLFSKLDLTIKDVILSGASVLVGGLFAVYGQIYQTGANAYDFFFGWTIAIGLWALISNFPPLWMIFTLLVNTSVVLYKVQVAYHWDFSFLFIILFLINSITIVGLELLNENKKLGTVLPSWFNIVLSIAAVFFITSNVIRAIFDDGESVIALSVLLAIITFAGAVVYGVYKKDVYYIALISTSVVIILSTLFGKAILKDIPSFFVLGVFIISCFTLLILLIVKLKKDWYGQQ